MAENLTKGIFIKTDKEIEIMKEGGEHLSSIKDDLKSMIKEGVGASEVEKVATELIKKAGGEPSFKMVPE